MHDNTNAARIVLSRWLVFTAHRLSGRESAELLTLRAHDPDRDNLAATTTPSAAESHALEPTLAAPSAPRSVLLRSPAHHGGSKTARIHAATRTTACDPTTSPTFADAACCADPPGPRPHPRSPRLRVVRAVQS